MSDAEYSKTEAVCSTRYCLSEWTNVKERQNETLKARKFLLYVGSDIKISPPRRGECSSVDICHFSYQTLYLCSVISCNTELCHLIVETNRLK